MNSIKHIIGNLKEGNFLLEIHIFVLTKIILKFNENVIEYVFILILV